MIICQLLIVAKIEADAMWIAANVDTDQLSSLIILFALILFETLALHKSFTYLLTYLFSYLLANILFGSV